MKRYLTFILSILLLCNSTITLNAEDIKQENVEKNAQQEITEDCEMPLSSYIEDDYDTRNFISEDNNDSGLLKASYRYSLVDNGEVTSVKDQRPYGTCWAFSAIASAESNYLKKKGIALDLSELQLTHFLYNSKGIADPLGLITNDGGSTTSSSYLDIGGNYYMSSYLMTSGVGLINESELDYSVGYGSIDDALCYKSEYYPSEIKWFNFSNESSSKQAIKDAIENDGAVGVSMYIDTSYLNRTTNAYYCDKDVATNHAITVVGWDDNYSKDNFKSTCQPSSNGAWLIKNSWGPDWHDDGYFWLSYEDASIQNQMAAQFFIDDKDFDYIYQYDGGAAATKYQMNTSLLSLANIYQAQNVSELTSVGFFTMNADINYTIKIYTKNKTMTSPVDGTLQSEVTGYVSNAGFHKIALAKSVDLTSNKYFAVVITLSGSSSSITYPFDVTDIESTYSQTNTKAKGESYISYSNGKKENDWCTVEDCGMNKATPRIKAYVNAACVHDYDVDNINWIWNSDYSSAIATLTCKNDDSHQINLNATINSTITKEATCSTKGEKTYVASITYEEKTYTDTKTQATEIDANKHNLKEVAYVAPTCTIEGNNQYYLCEECGKCFKSDKTTITNVADEKLMALGHAYDLNNIEWTWNEDNSTCLAKLTCNNDSSHVQEINATIDYQDKETPTCTKVGTRSYTASISYGSKTYSTTKNVELASDEDNHDLKVVEAKEATCTETGNNLYYVCNDCLKIFKADKKTLTTVEEESLAAINHDYGSASYEWSKDYSSVTAKRICKNDNSHVESETVYTTFYSTNHKCGEIGTVTYTANFSNPAFISQTKTVETSVIKHDYDYEQVEWTWSGIDSAKAKLTCKKDNSHILELNATITSEIIKKATVGEKGIKRYLATINYDGHILSDYQDEEIEKISNKNYQYEINEDVLIISGKGAIDNYDEDENILGINSNETITEVIISEGITSIGENCFKNFKNLECIELASSIIEIGDNAYEGCSNLNKIIYEGEREDFASINLNNNEIKDFDIVFNNGQYVASKELYYYQNKNKDIVIEYQKEMLSSVATYNQGGYVWLCSDSNNYSILNIEYTPSSSSNEIYEIEENLILNEEGNILTIPYAALAKLNVLSDTYSFYLIGSDRVMGESLFELTIEACKQVTEEPTIIQETNGDVKIYGELAYLEGLVKERALINYCYSDFRGSIVIQADEEDAGGVAFNYSTNLSYIDTTKILELKDSDTTPYVLLTKENQLNMYSGTLVNGKRTICLNSYGYEPYTTEVEVKYSLQVAPSEVRCTYDAKTHIITISSDDNSGWLDEVSGLIFYDIDTGRSHSYNSIAKTKKDKTISFNLIGLDLDGTYRIATYNGGNFYSDYDDGEYHDYKNACNKLLIEECEIKDLPKYASGTLSVTIEDDYLIISSSNETWLNTFVTKNTNNYTRSEYIDNLNGNLFSSLEANYLVIYNKNQNNGFVILNDEESTLIAKENNTLKISLSALRKAGYNLYNYEDYTIAFSSASYSLRYCYLYSTEEQKELAVPKDLSFKLNSNGDLIIQSNDTTYLKNIEYLIFYNDYYSLDFNGVDLEVVNGKITIAADDLLLGKGTYTVEIASNGYQDYVKVKAITIKNSKLKTSDNVELYLDDSGNLIISSSDINYIETLVNNSMTNSYCQLRAVALKKNYNQYSDNSYEDIYLRDSFEKIDDNTACYPVLKMSTTFLNGNYKCQLRVKGYELSPEYEIMVTKGINDIPGNIETEIIDNYFIIKINDEDYYENIESNNYYPLVYEDSLSYWNSVKTTYDLIWPGDSILWGKGGTGYPSEETTISFDYENKCLKVDLTNLDLVNKNYVVYLATSNGYLNINIPINNKIYTVNYHNDGGYTTNRTDYLHYYVGQIDKFAVELKTPEREGYTFSGWYRDENYKTKVSKIDLANENGDIDLYALFKPITYKITYNLDGGKNNANNPKTYNVQSNIELAEPTKTGYIFKGWYLAYDKNEVEPFSNKIETIVEGTIGNLTLYAKWELAEYNLSLNYNGGEVIKGKDISENTYNINSKLTLPTLAKEGYSFSGWYKDVVDSKGNIKQTKVTSISKSTGDLELYAIFKPISYKLTYNLNGGKNNVSNPKTYTIEDNIELLEPSRTGYIFDGWYLSYTKATKNTEEVYADKIDVINEQIGNLTLYAKWKPITYNLQYVSNDYVSEIITLNYDQSYKLSDMILANPGYKATKYTYVINGISKTVSATSSIKNLVSVDNAETIIFKVARDKNDNELWTKATYTITYNLNGGTNNSKNKKTYTIDSGSFSLLEPSKKGASFIGWYDEEGNKVSTITPSNTYFGNKTYTAKWELINYQISYDVNGGQLPLAYQDGYTTYTIEDSFNLLEPTRANYTFAGWYSGKTKVTTIKKGSTTDYNLVAKWTEGTNYTIVYDKNSSANGKVSNTKVTAGKNVTIAANAYKLTNKVFKCWNTKTDGSGTSYLPKQTILKSNPLSTYGNETITLYAIWDDVKTFNIEYLPNCLDYTGSMKSQTMSNASYKALTANAYKRNGYTFAGWTTNSDGSGITYANKATYAAYEGANEGTVTLYAKWTPITYKINYSGIKKTDTNNNPTVYTIEDDNIVLKDPTRKNYIFGGWYTDSKFKNQITTIETNTTKNVTIYAKWIEAFEMLSPNFLISELKGSSYAETVKNAKVYFKTIGANAKNISYVAITDIEKTSGIIESISIDGDEKYITGLYPKTAKIIVKIVK